MLTIKDHKLIETSENIIRGKVISTEAKWVKNNTLIYTFTKIQIDQNIIGKYKKGDTVTVVTPGGFDPVRGKGMRVSNQAEFEKDEEVVVFLNKAEGDVDAIDYTFLKKEPMLPSDLLRVNGYFQGKRKVFRDPVTKKMMIKKPNENRTIELKKHNDDLRIELKHLHR